MCPGLSDDLQQVDDARKTAIIDHELSRLNIDIAALQETRIPSKGTIHCSGKDWSLMSTDSTALVLQCVTPSCPQVNLLPREQHESFPSTL